MEETWKDIEGYEGLYQVSNIGRIKSKRKTFLSHRLVACSFIENVYNKRTVNHKDGNKQNNCIDNLEWNTYSENHTHSYKTLCRKSWMIGRTGKLNHNSKSVLMYGKDGVFIKRFYSIMDAERETGIKNSSIVENLKNRNHTAGGYIWKYE